MKWVTRSRPKTECPAGCTWTNEQSGYRSLRTAVLVFGLEAGDDPGCAGDRIPLEVAMFQVRRVVRRVAVGYSLGGLRFAGFAHDSREFGVPG